MSRLVHLLHAATLLATVTANMPMSIGLNCRAKTLGQLINDQIKLPQITVGIPLDPKVYNKVLDMPIKACYKYGYPNDASGEIVIACNKDENGPAPRLFALPDTLTPIYLTCSDDGCPKNVTIDTYIYC